MRKILHPLLCLLLTCVLAAGCGQAPSPSSGEAPSLPPPQGSIATKPNAAQAPTLTAIDVDLTGMSSTMVYALVYDMMVNPGDYLGQTIKASGPYTPVFYEETNKTYHYVVVEDATACCQQGLEFVWTGQHSYPDDYPADGAGISVTGIFSSYEEGEQTYYHLVAADVATV